jgi:hypothetical protein
MSTEVSYDEFMPEIMPYLPDVPELVVTQAIRNATIEFCQKTRYLQENLPSVTPIYNIGIYDLGSYLDGTYTIADVIEAWYGDVLLIPKSVEQLTKIYRANDWQNMLGQPYYFFRRTNHEVTIVPKPQFTMPQSPMQFLVAKTPTRASTTVDYAIYEHFLEQICFGARARLYGTPGQPYYDPNAALDYRKRFYDATNEVRERVNRSNSRAAVNVEYQRWV